jgi:hypothetical protein
MHGKALFSSSKQSWGHLNFHDGPLSDMDGPYRAQMDRDLTISHLNSSSALFTFLMKSSTGFKAFTQVSCRIPSQSLGKSLLVLGANYLKKLFCKWKIYIFSWLPVQRALNQKFCGSARCWWLTPVILPTWEDEIRRITAQGQPWQIVCKIPSPK